MLESQPGGLSEAEARRRLEAYGPNAVRAHRVQPWSLLWRQVRSPLLLLLALTAAVSAFVGEGTDAVIIGIILAASVGLGFGNEYRAERAAVALHLQIRHTCVVVRDGRPRWSTSPTSCPATSSSCGSGRWSRPTCGCCDVDRWPATSRC